MRGLLRMSTVSDWPEFVRDSFFCGVRQLPLCETSDAKFVHSLAM